MLKAEKKKQNSMPLCGVKLLEQRGVNEALFSMFPNIASGVISKPVLVHLVQILFPFLMIAVEHFSIHFLPRYLLRI